MKRKLLIMLSLALVFTLSFSVAVSASQSTEGIRLYDESGNEVFGGRVYYDANRVPVFGQGCWYYATDGGRADAYGMDAYRYDEDGNLIAAPYGAWCWGMGGGCRGRGRGMGGWGWR